MMLKLQVGGIFRPSLGFFGFALQRFEMWDSMFRWLCDLAFPTGVFMQEKINTVKNIT